MTPEEYRRRWLIYYSRYERKGLAIFRRGMRKAAQNIKFDSLSREGYTMSVPFNVGDLTETYIDFYTTIGLIHGKKIGRSINKGNTVKNFDPNTFEGSYRDFVTRWLFENAGSRIVSVRQELIDYLVSFIALKQEEGTDMRTIARELQKHILSRGFYRWQIERIVRTETTAAANRAAIRAGDISGVVLEKVWISSHDGRTRRLPEDRYDHYAMHKVRVGHNDKFNVQGDLVDFPGDPNGQPGNIINCRCAVALSAKRDDNGRIIYTDT